MAFVKPFFSKILMKLRISDPPSNGHSSSGFLYILVRNDWGSADHPGPWLYPSILD